ncbi:MAG: NAD(P)/FAD-dependent oxidoreductase [Fuerstiella sp.]
MKYDVVIIGGGHNGLVCAAYLAKAGRKVLVLERRSLPGGACVTEELWPGYRISTAAYVVSLLLPEVERDLDLRRFGYEVLPRVPSSFTPFADGRSLILGPDTAANQQQIAQFSKSDAERWPQWEALLTRIAERLEPVLSRTPPDLLPLPTSWRDRSWKKKLRDLIASKKLLDAFRDLKNDLPEAIEVLTGAARPLLERWFESDELIGTLATDAVIGNFQSISAPGTAYVLLHHVMGSCGGARGVWGYVKGGMGNLSNAIAAAAETAGATVQCDATVDRILTHSGRVSGVGLTDGQVFEADVVASGIDAYQTFCRLMSESDLPSTFRQAVERIDYSSASMKINLALSELPRFTCLPDSEVGRLALRGTIHINSSVQDLEQAWFDAAGGLPSRRPIVEMTIPSTVDSTLAPVGHHVASLFVQYAPYHLQDGQWDEETKERFADVCIDQIARYAPNIRDSVLHRQILSPVDLERIFGLTGGNIFQGAMPLHQLFSLRPVAGYSDYRTPVKGLYLCGSAAHPGGGVMGACGRNAATEILRD